MTVTTYRSLFHEALFNGNGIARRLIVALVLFSSAITAVITSIQLYNEYRSDLNKISESFDFVRGSAAPALIEGVWVADGVQIQTQLEGLLRLRDIEFIGVYVDGQLRWSAGGQTSSRVLIDRLPLIRPYRGQKVGLGELHTIASLDKVWTRLFDRLIVVLIENGIKTFLVAAFMLLVFQVLVTRHLAKLSAYARTIRLQGVATDDIKLDRPETGRWRPDALDHLTQTINDMQRHLRAASQNMNQANEALRRMNEELERRVQQRTAKLESANRELETFTYSVSHDLKAPLRGIDGYSRLLLEDYADKLDDEGRQFLYNVRQAAQQMGQLINDLLAYSRLERRELHAEPVALQDLIGALLARRAEEIKARGVAVNVTVPAVSVSADREGLTMALRNLLENALKFTRDTPHPEIEIGGRDTGDACILWVRDNGVGFDMKFHDKIFAIFQRLHRAEDYPGTGVGLAIVKKAMERMGGRAWAESEPGRGATFYLEIPK